MSGAARIGRSSLRNDPHQLTTLPIVTRGGAGGLLRVGRVGVAKLVDAAAL